MPIEALTDIDKSSWDQPDSNHEPRTLLESWLAYQRHEFTRKLRDMTPEQLAVWSIPPVQLSVIGLVRHMTQMEHVYLSWGLGGGEQILVYGDDDYAGGSPDSVEEDLNRYFAEVVKAELAIGAVSALDAKGLGHAWPLRATLVKMIDEYALHAGQAHMLRFAALGQLIR
jgi:hypothetical protein